MEKDTIVWVWAGLVEMFPENQVLPGTSWTGKGSQEILQIFGRNLAGGRTVRQDCEVVGVLGSAAVPVYRAANTAWVFNLGVWRAHKSSMMVQQQFLCLSFAGISLAVARETFTGGCCFVTA